MIDPRILELARTTLTDKQFQAWQHVHVHRLSIRASALHLGLHRSTFIDRYDTACLKLRRAGIHIDPSGNPYHQEPAA